MSPSAMIEARYNQFRNPYHARARAAAAALSQALSYRPRVQVVPDRQAASVAANGTYEGRVTVPTGAILWAIAASSADPAGFKLNLIDGGTGLAMASEAPFFSQLAGIGTTTVKDTAGQNQTIANPLFVLPAHRIFIEPAFLRVQIKNLAAVPNRVQVALHFAFPPATADAPRNEFNDLLDAELNLARRAQRGIDLTTGTPITPATAATTSDPLNQPATTKDFDVNAVGDNVIIPAVAGLRIAIHEMALYSNVQQDVSIRQGTPGGTPLQGTLRDFVGGTGLLYQKEEPHWVLDTGLPFVLNIAPGTTSGTTGYLSGYVKFRMLQHWGV